MYISQTPIDSSAEPEMKNKKSRAGITVFFINLFLMLAAFFIIKNQDKDRINNQKDSNPGDREASAEAATVTEDMPVPADKANQTEKTNSTENSVGVSNTRPAVIKSGNTGVFATTPPVSTNTSPQKPSKKTKTS
jgi:hypothetical protein